MPKIYPFQNRNPENLPNENWKEIPGWENYQVSNYGRVKSIERWVERHIWAGRQRMYKEICKPERILSQWIKVSHSPFNNDNHYYPCFSVHRGKFSKAFRTARMVYYLFVKKFPMESNKVIIQYLDDNGLNIRPDNLLLTGHPEKINKTLVKGRTPKIKKVTQFHLNGGMIKHYPSIVEAARAVKGQPSRIWTALDRWPHYYKGFLWCMGEKRRMKPLKAPLINFPKKVIQYSMKEEIPNTFPSLHQAAKVVGALNANLRKTLNDKCNTCKGYKWKWADQQA